MRYFLLIVGVLMWFAAAITLVSSKTVIHEIFASILGLSGSVLIGCGCIVSAVENLHRGLHPASAPKSIDDPGS